MHAYAILWYGSARCQGSSIGKVQWLSVVVTLLGEDGGSVTRIIDESGITIAVRILVLLEWGWRNTTGG